MLVFYSNGSENTGVYSRYELRENTVLPIVSEGNDKFCDKNSVGLPPSELKFNGKTL